MRRAGRGDSDLVLDALVVLGVGARQVAELVRLGRCHVRQDLDTLEDQVAEHARYEQVTGLQQEGGIAAGKTLKLDLALPGTDEGIPDGIGDLRQLDRVAAVDHLRPGTALLVETLHHSVEGGASVDADRRAAELPQ